MSLLNVVALCSAALGVVSLLGAVVTWVQGWWTNIMARDLEWGMARDFALLGDAGLLIAALSANPHTLPHSGPSGCWRWSLAWSC